jgi:hypothetical protein
LLGNSGVREGSKVGEGDGEEVGLTVAVWVGFGVKVYLGLGVIVIVGVREAVISGDSTTTSAGGVIGLSDCGLVNMIIETIIIITNTTPNKPIKKICWGEFFCPWSWGESSGWIEFIMGN